MHSAERAQLHWRHGQPIGLSSDEFTPPDRQAELLRGGQFALRISAVAFFFSSSACSLLLPFFFFFFSSFGFPSCSSVSPFALASSPFPATRCAWLVRRSCSRGRRSSGSEGTKGNVNSGEGITKYYGDLFGNFSFLLQIDLILET